MVYFKSKIISFIIIILFMKSHYTIITIIYFVRIKKKKLINYCNFKFYIIYKILILCYDHINNIFIPKSQIKIPNFIKNNIF